MTGEDPRGTTGTMDPVEIEYLEWEPEGSVVSIHMNPGVAGGIAHDVVESPGAEVGGLLLGRVVAGPRLAVWIERYQRVPCEHRFGPRFILDSGEISALEAAAADVLAAGELSVVGLYRSHTRPGFQLEETDFDLIRRYFSDPSDLILLVRGESGQFHAWDERSGARSLSGEFPLRGNVVGNVVKEETTPDEIDVPTIQLKSEPVRETRIPDPPRELPRRLVPDFVSSPVEAPPSLYGLGQNSVTEELTEERGSGGLKKWLPLAAALLLVGGALAFVLLPGAHGPSHSAPAQTAEANRPLGLYVDPGGQTWRVLWNPKATALIDARNVQLFVREKGDQNADDQKHYDLSAQDLASGSYEYQPVGNDVTFRLEVTDQAGRVSAESFRLVRTVSPPAPSPAPRTVPPPAGEATRVVQPKPIYRAPPIVAAGVRPRIKGIVPIDVRVQIDAHGHVISATPVTKHRSGLDEYLASRAVQAARRWRFEPARENGKAVAGTQIIHFVFEK